MKPLWDAIRSKIVYDIDSNTQDPVTFYARFALWSTAIGCVIAISLSLLQNDPVAKRFLHIDLMVLLPGAIFALIVGYSQHKLNVLYANMIIYTAIYIAFLLSLTPASALSIFPSGAHQASANYYIYLPLIAMSYIPLIIIWEIYPKATSIFGAVYAVMITGGAILVDHGWREQIGAFYVFYIILTGLILFSLVLRHMTASTKKTAVLAHKIAIEVAAHDKMLAHLVKLSFPALFCFASNGKLITKCGAVADQFMPSAHAQDMHLTLNEFVQHFKTKFAVDLNIRNTCSWEIRKEGHRFMVSRLDASDLNVTDLEASDIVAFALIETTEKHDEKARLNETQRLEMPW